MATSVKQEIGKLMVEGSIVDTSGNVVKIKEPGSPLNEVIITGLPNGAVAIKLDFKSKTPGLHGKLSHFFRSRYAEFKSIHERCDLALLVPGGGKNRFSVVVAELKFKVKGRPNARKFEGQLVNTRLFTGYLFDLLNEYTTLNIVRKDIAFKQVLFLGSPATTNRKTTKPKNDLQNAYKVDAKYGKTKIIVVPVKYSKHRVHLSEMLI